MTATFDPAPVGTLADLAGQYVVDASHSRLGFQARHAMVTTVRGQFGEFEGKATLAEDPTQSSITVTAQIASVVTGSQQRDEHLHTSDFFDAATYPTMSFTSTSIERVGDSEYAVTGDLTIKDVTRPVTFDLELTGTAKDPFGNSRVGFEGGAVINRKDWGLVWNVGLEAGGVLVSDKVKIELDFSLIKEQPAA